MLLNFQYHLITISLCRLQLRLKREEIEFQTEYGDIEKKFISMIEHCGMTKDDFPIPTPARGIIGTPSFIYSTPGSLTRVSALSNLAEEDIFLQKDERDQSNCDDLAATVLAEDTNDTTFFDEIETETGNEKGDVEDDETSQCVPVMEVGGERLYRIIEGQESKVSNAQPRNCRKKHHPLISSTMISHVTNSTRSTKKPKLMRQKSSHPRACSTFIGTEAMVDETKNEDGSIWSTDDSSRSSRISDSSIEKTEFSFLRHSDAKEHAQLPRTSTRLNLASDMDNQRVPDLTDSLFSRLSADSSNQRTKEITSRRHCALRDSGLSSCSTLGSMGDNSVFEKPQEESRKNKIIKKTGLLRRQTCYTQLSDKKALAKKIKRFNSSLRSQEFRDAHTLLVI